ncbi:hypothetical protein Tsubulata_032710 [Turnera subulata]|uniref:Protein kinase domain-containing protein n=1 Tax=Turnera subulata TaxID=218843 RepID=A0A9Q0J5K2_9ROSI|nr:hypothetical protein Tsubulata_032710 [Turnera subulata]
MSDDMLIHFSSNSSNQSDHSLPTKIAKLEARLVGKAASASVSSPAPAAPPQPPPPPPPAARSVKLVPAEDLAAEPLSSSDSDDDNEGEFLIQAKTLKRQRLQEDDNPTQHHETPAGADGRQKIGETTETKVGSDVNRRKQSRGRGQSVSGRGRGSRVNDQARSQNSASTALPSNGQLENSYNKAMYLEFGMTVCYFQDNRPKEPFRNDDHPSLEEEVTHLRAKVTALEEELRKSHQEASEKRQEARLKVRQDSLRLGNVGVIRAGTLISETWEDGQALKDLNSQLRQLLETKEAVERQRKSLKKRQSDKSDAADAELGAQEEDFLIQDEIFKSRLASIKREEETFLRERDRYELEKGRLIREMKRIRDEDGSRFNNFQVLNRRYALLNLLGKGGFSEVYKAFDLAEHRYVACKLHGLNAQWSEEKKQSYIRHAIREYNIHKILVHNHIVRLWDIFEIDHNTFCTVLEYCSGKDLDAVLKATPILPEKEARIIIVQIFQGLVYLNKRAQRIIHYDLKPGNVLFDELGVAKVTDFGLSKIVEDDVGSQGMELTSQGAGTYWYLPPECFELSRTPLISSKVDVWSAGVLFYQMLFGKRPFGHDQTQERILREDTIIKARRVEFPSKPTVSNEAKCLHRSNVLGHSLDERNTCADCTVYVSSISILPCTKPYNSPNLLFSNSNDRKRSFNVVTKCESKESSSPEASLPAKSSGLEVGSPIIVIEAPKMVKTAAAVPCLRVNSGLVKPGDVGR